jgi:hypothetical protein
MNYDEVRDKIKTGDVISVRAKNGIIADMIRLVTRSPYSHSGIAIWLGDGLWMAEINSGHNHLVPLSQYQYMDFDVFECPADRDRTQVEILQSLRFRIDYGILSFFMIGYATVFGAKGRFTTRKAKVCSEYVQTILINSGWSVPDKMVSPADLASKLTLKFEVRQ